MPQLYAIPGDFIASPVVPDGVHADLRLDRMKALAIQESWGLDVGPVLEGQSWLTSNLAVTAPAIPTAYSQQAAFGFRSNASAGGVDVILLRLGFRIDAIGAGITALHCAVSTMQNAVISGALGSQNRRPDLSTTGHLDYLWSTTHTIGANFRLLNRIQLKQGALVVGDAFYIYFGGNGIQGFQAFATSNPRTYPFYSGPLVLSPQNTMLFHVWAPGLSSAPNVSLELLSWER